MRRLLSVLLLVAAVAVPNQTGASTWAERSSVVADGVPLTLSVPARVYPRDALIAVRVSLRNISPRTIWESPMVVGYCSRVTFLVSVLDASGQALDPLPPAPGPYPPCPAPLPYLLRSGQAVSRQVYAVLLAGRLRAMANVNTLSGTRNYAGTDLTTPTVTVRLYPAAAPSVSIGTANDSVAVIARPAAARGPLRYEEWSDCGARALQWTAAAGDQVHAGCLNPGEWHLVAGWVGYPAAILDITPRAAALSERGCGAARPRSISPDFAPAVGGPPVWAVGFEGSRAMAMDGQKILWAIDGRFTDPVTVSGWRVKGHTPLHIQLAGGDRANSAVLDPRHPLASQPYHHGWPKPWAYFPSNIYPEPAGCWVLHAQWPGGSWSLSFRAG